MGLGQGERRSPLLDAVARKRPKRETRAAFHLSRCNADLKYHRHLAGHRAAETAALPPARAGRH